MVKRIMWDPGHGGVDPGAVANGLQEKDVTFKIVQYAMTYLESNYYDFEQRATRVSDTTLELFKRDDPANAWPADVFVSVHINAGGGTGFESFIYYGASSGSVSLQNIMHAEILAAMRQFGSITDRGKKQANFAVLRATNMPSILTENLFIDSSDANRLKDEAFLKAVAGAHARGVAMFLGLPQKTAKQNEWKLVGGKWYFYENGVMAKNKWVLHSDNKWYFLLQDGSMATNKWIDWKGKWYYVLASGAMATGWIQLGGKWYFLDRVNGDMKTGYITENGERYFLQGDGSLLMTDSSGAIQ
jgi:N-acetylmuramoyl-L-alanine amidase